MDAASRACAPPTLSKDMYNGCGSVSRRSLGEHSEFPGRHLLRLAFVLLEPSDGKLSRSVPRGLGAGNRAWLPSNPSFCHQIFAVLRRR